MSSDLDMVSPTFSLHPVKTETLKGSAQEVEAGTGNHME